MQEIFHGFDFSPFLTLILQSHNNNADAMF